MPRPPRAIKTGGDRTSLRVTILYPPAVMECVQALAQQQGIACTALLRHWSMQRLDEEEERRTRRMRRA